MNLTGGTAFLVAVVIIGFFAGLYALALAIVGDEPEDWRHA